MISTSQSSMAFSGGMAALAVFAIGKTVYDRLRPRHRRAADYKKFWNTIGTSAFLLFAGLIFIGIGVREYYDQPLQHLWPLRTFWPQY
jgi:NhaP-type Na+/H+ or K+/H+ antiporter